MNCNKANPARNFEHCSDSGGVGKPLIVLGANRQAVLAWVLVALGALAGAGCRKSDFPQYPENYREYAYVTNGQGNTVSIIDLVHVRVQQELPVGQNPVAVAASVQRNEVYVVSAGPAGGRGSLSVIDAEKNTVAATVALGGQPASIDLDAEGNFAYIANSGSNSVSVVDLKARREVAAIGAGEQPVAARIARDGKSLVVANRMGNSVTVIDPAARRVRAIFENCPGASNVAMAIWDPKAFVACSAGHQVMVVSLAHDGKPDQLQTLLNVGHGPAQLVLKPDGGEIFSMNARSNTISEIVTSTNDVGGAYPIGEAPGAGLISADNTRLFVANTGSQEVGIFSVEDGRRSGVVHVGDGPAALAFSAAGHLLLAVDQRSSDLAVVRTSTNSMFTFLPTGRGPNAIAVKAYKLP